MTAPNTFTPSVALILSVSQGQTTVVTFTTNHSFVLNEIISFRISRPFGMVELNNQKAKIIALSSNTITIPISSINYTAFTFTNAVRTTPAICVPVGSGISFFNEPATVILFDAFDNVTAGNP